MAATIVLVAGRVQAGTVAAMLAVLLGLVAGTVLALFPVHAVSDVVTQLADGLVDLAHHGVAAAFACLPGGLDDAVTVKVVIELVSVMIPGFIALLLLLAAAWSAPARRAISVALVAGAALSFFVLPAEQAAVVLAGTVVVALLLSVLTDFLLVFPAVTLAACMVVQTVTSAVHGTNAGVAASAARVAVLVPELPHSVIQLGLTGLALVPCLCTALAAVRTVFRPRPPAAA